MLSEGAPGSASPHAAAALTRQAPQRTPPLASPSVEDQRGVTGKPSKPNRTEVLVTAGWHQQNCPQVQHTWLELKEVMCGLCKAG